MGNADARGKPCIQAFLVHVDSDSFSVVYLPVDRTRSVPVAKLYSQYWNLRVTGPVQASAALELDLPTL
jgi:hypothetical protein